MEKPLELCIDKRLPVPRLEEAADSAKRERLGNAPDGSLLGDAIAAMFRSDVEVGAAVLLTSKKWQAGRELKVGWFPGPYFESDKLREKIRYHVNALERYMNLNFRFVGFNPEDADIRLSDERGGSWSYLGTDNLLIPRDEPTLQLGWLTPDSEHEEIRRVVKHEFLHAADLGHEQSHPHNDRQYNKPYVYDYFARTQGWSREETDAQFFRRYSAGQVSFSDYDVASIMHYAVPPEFLLDKSQAVGWNDDLSAGDKAFLRRTYPYPGQEAA